MQQRILYDSRSEEYKTPFGCVSEDEKCNISLDVPKSCPVKRIELIVEREDGLSLTVPLVYQSDDNEKVRYSCTFSLYSAGLYFYYFRFVTDISTFSLYRIGDHDTNMESGDKWQLTCLPKDYRAPEKFEGKVMYQIFPDRFNKSGDVDLTGKLGPYHIHIDVNELPYKGADENGNWNTDFYGGNLKGITDKLPYLEELGVEVIYINPIFKAFSNHRYDTADYKTIDPMLGTEADLAELCKKAKKRGMSVVIDGVFSHVGENSIYFDKYNVFGGGAVSSYDSPYRKWFRFSRYPDEYESWWGISSLPCVEELEPSYIDYIVTGEDSVIAHWMKCGVSGFRLDVADELPDEFIQVLRSQVKKIDPDGYVLGEVWEDASNKCSYGVRRKYFCGAELDGVMNYPFRVATIQLMTGEITACDYISRIMSIYENYPFPSLLCSMNMLSTHDTARILTEFEKTVGAEQAVKALMAATSIQYFLPGMPCIYYGDEVGMKGEGDPYNRGYYNAGIDAETLLPHYTALGQLRKHSKALKKGKMELHEDNGDIVISRYIDDEKISLKVILSGNGRFETEIH